MRDPLRDQSQTVPDHEDARRDRDPPAGVDHISVSAQCKRLNRVSLDSDPPRLFRLGPESMPDEGIAEDSDRLGPLGLLDPGPLVRRSWNVDLADGAIATGDAERRPRPHVRMWKPFVP